MIFLLAQGKDFFRIIVLGGRLDSFSRRLLIEAWHFSVNFFTFSRFPVNSPTPGISSFFKNRTGTSELINLFIKNGFNDVEIVS